MSEKDKKILDGLCESFEKLTSADRIRITGIAEGMVIARESTEKLKPTDKPTDKKTEDAEETKND